MDQETFVAQAAAEERRLLAELANIDAEYQKRRGPLLRKLEAVRLVKTTFGSEPELDLPHHQMSAESLAKNVSRQALQTRENSQKARVLTAAEELLRGGERMPTPVLLEKIEERGIVLTATNKAGALSVMLSKDKRFVSDRRTGWSLTQKNPQDVAASAGSLPT